MQGCSQECFVGYALLVEGQDVCQISPHLYESDAIVVTAAGSQFFEKVCLPAINLELQSYGINHRLAEAGIGPYAIAYRRDARKIPDLFRGSRNWRLAASTGIPWDIF
ncbi:MAG: hypothetical protein NTY37_12965 [Methanothrix sp.]|nr:hypothetical protein [Methanothrix sp.]